MQAESATGFYEKFWRFNMELNILFSYLYLSLFWKTSQGLVYNCMN